ENPCSLDELMAHADKLMYEQKQNRKGLLLQAASLSSRNPYPRHYWPDDPRAAKPTAQAKKKRNVF
ncbi:MAG TPA: hypothetical protein VIK21_10430, partial [Desulfuromonadaceae bacterium]